MRAWFLTNTTFGTWLPGDPRGSVTSVRDRRPGDESTPFRIEHDLPGEPWEDAIPALHASAAINISGPPVHLTLAQAKATLEQFQETANFRNHVLRAVSVMINHFHIVVQVTADPDPTRLLADSKVYATRRLNRTVGQPPSETWWTGNGSKRKIKDDQHLGVAINYTLYKQFQPLVVWSPETGRIV